MPQQSGNPSITDLASIGTDPYRIQFRYSDMLPAALETLFPARDIKKQLEVIAEQRRKAYSTGDFAKADWWITAGTTLETRSHEFPSGHRLAFGEHEVVGRNGYLNAPLFFAWMRAPYLHNGSVLSLRALIGIDARLPQFCRGGTGYDPLSLGVATVLPIDGKCPASAPFLFDTVLPGNSRLGHNFPPTGSVSRADLDALLSYLGTL